jgi:probable phosphoglycerate mutase
MIYIVRHGQTDWNIGKGSRDVSEDIPLNPEGIRQAQATAASLENIKFDLYFSSPMMRAKQTMRILAGAAPINTDTRLCETNFGAASQTKYTYDGWIAVLHKFWDARNNFTF